MNQPIYTHRRIFKSVVTSRKVIQELITLMMVGELLDPGSTVWIVSPWISDVPLLDNRAGSFDAVNPEWGHPPGPVNGPAGNRKARGRPPGKGDPPRPDTRPARYSSWPAEAT